MNSRTFHIYIAHRILARFIFLNFPGLKNVNSPYTFKLHILVHMQAALRDLMIDLMKMSRNPRIERFKKD